jgi:ADP-ribose pyrophosphatase
VTEGRIDSRRVYTGRILSLDIDRVRFPDGSEGELELVRHPGASAILPFLSDPAGQDPEILLIRQYRYAAGSYVYEVPAGCLEPGEAPVDCARRELREETGCEAEQLSLMTSVFTTPGFTDEVIHLFMATGITRGTSHREADEFLEIETMGLSRALAMIERGEIRDAKTIVALLFAAGFRAGR